MRIRLLQVAAAALLLCAASVASAEEPASGEGQPPTEGSWAPSFRLDAYNAVPDLADLEAVGLDAFVGVRPQHPARLVLLVFASTSAPPTIDAFSVLRKMQRRFGARGLQVVVVASDADTVSMAEAVSRQRLTFPVLRDRFGIVAERWGISTPPASFLIDRQGRIRGVSDQPVKESEAAIREAVLRLLSGDDPLPSGP